MQKTVNLSGFCEHVDVCAGNCRKKLKKVKKLLKKVLTCHTIGGKLTVQLEKITWLHEP